MSEFDKPMYFGATASTFEKARQLRANITPEETILWERLKGKQICNVRFRRQHPINKYIVDFYCHEAKLVIELDGKIHLKRKGYDKDRTRILNELNLDVIRFSNEKIHSNIEEVLRKVTLKVNKRM